MDLSCFFFQAEARRQAMIAAGKEVDAGNMLEEADDDLLF